MMRSRKRNNSAAARGLVNKSAWLSAEQTKGTTTLSSSTFSRIKKWRRSICFTRPKCSGLYAMSWAAWLSTCKLTGSSVDRPSYARKALRWRASLVASESAISSASHDDKATVGCFLDDQEIAASQKWNTAPDVDRLTVQSELE